MTFLMAASNSRNGVNCGQTRSQAAITPGAFFA
jgi:hypothetical protein